jgi:hypothetical protein
MFKVKAISMSKRVFTSTSKKEQLKQAVLRKIKEIRDDVDPRVLEKAEAVANAMQDQQQQQAAETRTTANSKPDEPVNSNQTQASAAMGASVPYDQKSAKQTIAHFVSMQRENKALCTKIMKMLQESHS